MTGNSRVRAGRGANFTFLGISSAWWAQDDAESWQPGALREIFAATTREQALRMAEAVVARWESSHPVVARLLEEGIEDCLACLAFPLGHRARIRTTNGLERLHEEIKRRASVVRIFPNAGACLRLVTALCVEQSEEWLSGRRSTSTRASCRAPKERVCVDVSVWWT